VQALGGGSLELRALGAAPRRGTASLTAAPGGSDPADAGEEPDGPVHIPIEDALDLHAFAPRDIPSVVAEYLEAARARGFTEVRLIHGRGIGVQRARVRSVLDRHHLVASYADAPPERGGPGATVVRLR
jgi:dsDNA-specific endonuclease/ATPase MutS2